MAHSISIWVKSFVIHPGFFFFFNLFIYHYLCVCVCGGDGGVWVCVGCVCVCVCFRGSIYEYIIYAYRYGSRGFGTSIKKRG